MNKLFVVGDSISINYGPYIARFLPEGWQYARKTGIPNNTTFAVDDNGGNSNHVLDYLRYRLDVKNDLHPDVLLLNCGLHDIRRDPKTDAITVPIEQYENNLRSIRQLLLSREIRVIWVTTTPVDNAIHLEHESSFIRRNEDVLAYNHVASNIFAQHATIDLYQFTQQLAISGLSLYSDHVHFTELVCQLQGTFLSGALSQLL